MDLFRNVVKSFYTASLLYDVQTQFGELSDEVSGALQIINCNEIGGSWDCVLIFEAKVVEVYTVK